MSESTNSIDPNDAEGKTNIEDYDSNHEDFNENDYPDEFSDAFSEKSANEMDF